MMGNAISLRRVAALLILISSSASWRAAGAEPDAPVRTFLDAADPAARQAAIAAIRAASPDPLAVERALHRGRTYRADVKKGWQVFQHIGSDGKERPYHVYVPKGYDAARKHPVIVILHGGVSRANLLARPQLDQLREGMPEDADKYGRLIILPLGQRGATWFDAVGMDNILAQLAAVKRRYNVDEDRAFVGGFSDGGSGGFFMGLYHPTPWAGVFALSGSVTVAALAPDSAFPVNLSNRPIHATSGGLDPLYPSALQKILIDQLQEQGARIAWTDYPASGHDASYMKTEDPKLNHFLLETARDPAPKHIVWETANPKVGRCDWVRINEIRDVGNNGGPELSNLTMVGPASFGFLPDMSFAGPGVRIKQVFPGVLPETAGVKANDVLTSLDGVEIKTVNDVLKVGVTQIILKKKGDPITGEYRRGTEKRSFRAIVPELPRTTIFKRTGPAGRLEVKASGNKVEVTARSVARYTLLIRRGLFDLDQPIQVLTNGKEGFHARVNPDLNVMLEQAAEDDDRSAVYVAKIEINVPAGAAQGRR